MDPPAMMNDNGYHLAEIWQYPAAVNHDSRRLQAPSYTDTTNRDTGTLILGNDPVGDLDQKSGHLGARRRRQEDEPPNIKTTSSNGNGNGNVTSDGEGKRLKISGGGGEESNNDSKAADEAEPSSGKPSGKKAQTAEPLKDYIHVRARRGQATDSHSLAERARREKISERMKILQDLVPGCNKVIGKALVLDEIINYIQSLQRQVEFLSMKLEAVNTRIEPGIDVFTPKEGFQFVQQAFDTTGMAFGSQATREFSRGTSPEWLHMQLGGAFERTT